MNKPLVILISVLVVTEFLIMQFLVDAPFLKEPWMPVVLDAVLVSFAAIITVALLLRKHVRPSGEGRREWMSLKIGATVFSLEAAIMLTMYILPFPIEGWQETLIDVTILGLVSAFLIDLFVLKPTLGTRKDVAIHPRRTLINAGVAYLVLVALLALLMLANDKNQREELRHALIEQETQALELLKTEVHYRLLSAILDILVLANQRNLLDLVEQRGDKLAGLQADYQELQRIKSYYHQIRLIDAAGNEVVRTDRTINGPKLIRDENLQNKSDRYYFQEGIQLQPGSVYISPFDLNVEHGQIEIPFKSMLRLVTPVVNNAGVNKGILVLNVDGNQILDELTAVESSMSGELMLLNEDGYWIYGGEEKYLWAFMFPEMRDFSAPNLLPELWQEIGSVNKAVVKTDKGIVVYKRFDDGNVDSLFDQAALDLGIEQSVNWPSWIMVSRIHSNGIQGQMSSNRQFQIVLILMLISLLGVGTALLTQANLKKNQAELKIKQMAMHDGLTGLVNRKRFGQALEEEVSRARRQGDSLALMYMDLDEFKPINDKWGHLAGDEVLRQVGERLKSNLRITDIVARMGGDEFAAILPNSGPTRELSIVAQRIIDSVSQPMEIDGGQCQVGITIGINKVDDLDVPLEQLIHQADRALYEGKRAGKNHYCFVKSA